MNTKPRPPAHLNKELTRVWVGWCMIGDREVAREAAAKGIYISLALEFIAVRKDWDHSDVERWFRTEILSWVYQLVEHKQIFKASHILQNIGIEPSEQLSIILTETCNKDMRNYVAEHLLKNGNLNNELFNNWKFIQCVEQNNNLFNVFDDLSQISMQRFELKTLEWKENNAALLFFNVYDFHLESFLTSKTSWHILLSYEKLDILKLWINIYFSQNTQYELKCNMPPEIYLKLKNLFLIWEITNCMIDQIKNSSCNKIVQDFVLFELSKFGIFLNEDKNDIQKIVSRFSKSLNVDNIFNILENPNSCLSINEFYEKLNDYCIKNDIFELLSICPSEFNCLNNKKLLLWVQKKETLEITEELLLKNIGTVLSYFSDNTDIYLQKNPLILLALMLFTNTNFYETLFQNKFIYNNVAIDSKNITNYFSNLPVIKNVLIKFISPKFEDNNLYDILKKEIFNFRNENLEIPNFSDKSLCENFGIKENINYVYYIKQQRPSQAYKLFILDQFYKNYKLDQSNKTETGNNIYDLVLKNNFNSEILISCISFLEMIDCDTKKIRIIANVLKILNINNLFINENLENVLYILENKILEKDSIFINTIKKHELLIDFAKYNKLDLPHKYLQYCTQNNLWLEFIIFIQIYNYPIEQCLNLIENFENKNLFEHIYHAFCTEIDSEIDLSTSISSVDDLENIFFSQKSNFLKILVQCHKSQDPPTNLLQAAKVYKNPVFSIISTCYEPDSVVINWLSWLAITTNIEFNVENYSVSPNFVSDFLKNVLLKKMVKNLLQSFEIFMNENPLYFLIKFVYNCIFLKFNNCMEYLKQFEKLINNLNYNPQLIKNDFEYTYLTNSYWLMTTSLKLIFATLNCFDCKNYQIKFLRHLCSADFAKNIQIDYPNFCKMCHLLQNLSSNINIDFSKFLNSDERKEEIVKCVEYLVNKKQYKDALELAKYENICKEYILIQEWSEIFKSKNCNFFENSNFALENAEILPSSAAEFYVYCCTEFAENSEKYKSLKLAYNWLKKSSYSDEFTEQVEKEIWINYFSLNDETLKKSYFEKSDNNYLLSEILKRTTVRSKFDQELNDFQKRHFEETLGKILKAGDFVQALRLEKMFGLTHPETEIVKTCYELAEGKLKPYEITTEQRLLFLNTDMNLKNLPLRRRTVKSIRTSIGSYDSLQSVLSNTNENDEKKEDTLALLETMVDKLKYGSYIVNNILMTYRISININQTYQEVLKCLDSKNILSNLNNYKNKLEIIQDTFFIFKWEKSEITDFIFEELQYAIRNCVYNNLESIFMWDLDLDTEFHLVLQLCPETNSILAKKLIYIATNLQEKQIANKNIEIKEISIIVELLIRAHDCYNNFCNMEGIANILRKCQTLILLLVNLKNYKLMVRLLTGIGRYTEMNYIFQILKENDQFEFLLKRNYRQNNSLKIALLKFMKKNCPKNQDLYKIIALHFTLFSEVAEIWESEAKEMTYNLIEISKLETQNFGRNFDSEIVLFTNNDSTKIILNNIMNNYTLAAEYHIHGEKLNSAMHTAKRAELIALQICLLKNIPQNNNTICVLNLTNRQILQVISNDLSYPHSKILVDSYNYQTDWGSVIFKHCIVNANSEYLEDYLSFKPLNNTLAQDLTRRFLVEKNISANSVNAMKNILKKLDSVHMKYRLASELGFSDVIETLLHGSQLDYLKDTVWKKGYKQL